MRTRVLSASLALILTLALLSGCESGNYNEWQRVVCEVELVNEGGPLVSAYVEDGGDGIIGGFEPDDVYPFDAVPVIFRARPYSLTTMTVPEDDVYSSFIVTGYNLLWQPSANVPAGLDLSQWNVSNGAFYLKVPVFEDAASAVMVADRNLKEGIINALGGPWNSDQDFTANARLEFIGHASGSKHEVVIPAGVQVTFTFAVTAE